MPRSTMNSMEKLTLYGEDPVKGVIGPGQFRRGSYQGDDKLMAIFYSITPYV